MGYGHYTRNIDGLERHLGYAVPCLCDHPGCEKRIDRGLAFLCGEEPGDGGGVGCGRYFCESHRSGYRRGVRICSRCEHYRSPWPMKPDLPDALDHLEWCSEQDRQWAVALSERSRTGRH